jgi:hypothetical protein
MGPSAGKHILPLSCELTVNRKPGNCAVCFGLGWRAQWLSHVFGHDVTEPVRDPELCIGAMGRWAIRCRHCNSLGVAPGPVYEWSTQVQVRE